MENMDKGFKVPKWVLINQIENTPNVPKYICPNCLPKPKDFDEKWLHGASVVRVSMYTAGTVYILGH
jgi:hypothetical protein